MSRIHECPNCGHELHSFKHNALKNNLNLAKKLYWEEKLSTSDIGARFGITGVRVRQVFKEMGIPLRSPKENRALVLARRESQEAHTGLTDGGDTSNAQMGASDHTEGNSNHGEHEENQRERRNHD